MFSPSLTYGELHKASGNHDLFNYHLRELVAKGLILKNGSSYSLSSEGRQQVSLMEEDGQYQKQFKVSMFIDLLRYHEGNWQMLLFRRKKHPHYDYIGAVTGKLKWGESLEHNMRRELQEELAIVPTEFKVAGIHREIIRNETGEIVGDGVFFVIFVTKWEGSPNSQNIEGEYFWHDIDKIFELDKIFRKGFETGLPHIKEFLANPTAFTPYITEPDEEKLEY